jgi:hypothetical protein
MKPLPHHLQKNIKNNLNKEHETSHQRGAMVRHASKTPRLPETERTNIVTREADRTLDGF